MALPTDPKARKAIPVWSGCIAYFPNSLVAIAGLSQRANDQHNPGEPLHWAMEKSTDEQDAGMRHAIEPLLIGASEYDADGSAHKVKKAWRAVAELERWLLAGNPAFIERGPPVEAQRPPRAKCRVTCGAEKCAEGCYFEQGHAGACVGISYETKPDIVPMQVQRCCWTSNASGQRCTLSDGHPGDHKVQRPRICTDCGVDLDEQSHAASCLRSPRQHW